MLLVSYVDWCFSFDDFICLMMHVIVAWLFGFVKLIVFVICFVCVLFACFQCFDLFMLVCLCCFVILWLFSFVNSVGFYALVRYFR